MIDSLKKWGPYITSVLTAVGSAYAFVNQELQVRIDTAVEAHNVDYKETSHPKFRVRFTENDTFVDKTSTSVKQLQEKYTILYDALYEMYWIQVGEKAAEIAPPSKRSQEAAAARDKFERLVGEGIDLQDAFRRSVHSWFR